MPKYIVSVREVYCNNIMVEALDEDDAIIKAEANMAGTPPEDLEYDYTLDTDKWTVHALKE